ncbi:MAG: N-acetylglucosamine-6-phosphate deacetylase [Kiritimatiellia bacterium]
MATGLIKNAYIVSPDYEFDGGAIVIADGKIAKVLQPGTPLPRTDWVYDAEGHMVLPGFIDVHTHGAMSVDVTDPDPTAVEKIAQAKLEEGCTSWCPTTLTLPEDQLADALRHIEAYRKHAKYSKVLGTHLEGPFINCECCGAQNPAYVRKPDIEEVKRLNAISPVCQVSYAPEVENGAKFAAECLAMGIVPSAGHTKCSYKEFKSVYAAGLRHLTHFCNQMTPLHHRDIGLVGAGLLLEDLRTEMICDKIHLCPDMIELAFQTKDIESILLITDSMRASHMPDGKSSLGGLEVIVKEGAARLASNGALAGSILRMNVALKNVWEVTGMPLSVLVKTTSYNQALEHGLEDSLGCIEPGYIADMVVLDDETFDVKAVFVDGEKRL